jgi:intein-encoded DNA endonuclease-like protein
MQNIGKVKLSNKNLTEYLQNTFNSTSYKNLQEGNTEFDGGKQMYIRKIFKGFKDKAYYEMLKEYPEVKKAIMEVQKEKYGFLKRKKGNDLEIKNVLLP